MMETKIEKRNSLLILLISFTFTSCASQVEVLTPSSMFIYPESSGETGKGTLTLHNMNGSMLGVSLSATSEDESLETGKSQIALGATGFIGMNEKIDIYAKAGTHSPNIIGAKIQLKGENQQETHSKNTSVAIILGAGQNNYTGSGNENFNLELTDADFSFNRTHTTAQFGVLAGWRYEQYILLYGGYTKLIENIHGKVDYDGSPVDGKSIDIDGNHTQYTLGWLYEYDKYNLAAEYSFQQMHWIGDSQKMIQTFNFGIGFDY